MQKTKHQEQQQIFLIFLHEKNRKTNQWQAIHDYHILFIIIMETKSAKIMQAANTRSSRRLKSKLEPLGQGKQGVDQKIEYESSDNNNHICVNIDQQLKLKTQKESTSLVNNEGLVVSDKKQKIRPVTRSLSNISNRINHEIDIQVEQFTPENNILSKIQDQQTSKKMSKSTSAQDYNDVQLSDINITNKKISHKAPQIFTSPYSEIRKSYRKVHKRQIITIPYRKCHDALQGRIVGILNKLENGKNCLRDFEGLIEKMNKIANKDIMNRFIISGIKTIINLTIEKNIYDPKIISKLQEQQKKLQQKITQELDGYAQYENDQYHKNNVINLEDYCQFKSLTIRRIYKILSRKYPKRREQLRCTIANECSKLFQSQLNMSKIMKFIRHRLELQV